MPDQGSVAAHQPEAGRPRHGDPGTGVLAKLGGMLDGPLTGIAPWIVLGVFDGPGRVLWAASVALGLSVLFLLLDLARGRSPKLLGAVDVVFFAALLVAFLVVGSAGQQWLETWIGELSNIALTLISVGSILIGVPFTLQYAREQVDRQYWDSPAFLSANNVITGVWAAAFLVSSAAGFYGDAVLHTNNNLWTGWIIQVGAMIFALQFSSWYPDRARARVARANGNAGAQPPPVGALLAPLTVWLVPIGILTLVMGSGPTWLGIAFIVAGAVLGSHYRRGAGSSAPRPSTR